MAYVVLNTDGVVTGRFANPQPQLDGYAELPDDDPRVLAHQKPSLAPITKRQVLTWLLLNAKKVEADVVVAISTIPDEMARARALIAWSYPDGGLFRRSEPLFDALGPLFNMTPADVDAAFEAASHL